MTITRAGSVRVVLLLNATGRRLLRAGGGRLSARLALRFKPKGGRPRTRSKAVTLLSG
jgi:hypothetical protein